MRGTSSAIHGPFIAGTGRPDWPEADLERMEKSGLCSACVYHEFDARGLTVAVKHQENTLVHLTSRARAVTYWTAALSAWGPAREVKRKRTSGS